MSTPQLHPNQLEAVIIELFTRVTSACLMILGRRETGKTDLSLLIAQILDRFQIFKAYASNIRIYESTFHIEHITNLQDLELWCRNTQGKKLFILDEAGKSLRRRSPMSGLNIQLLDNLQILRKYKLSIIMIAPHEKYIDSAVLGSDVLDGMIVKPNFKNPKVALYKDLFGEDEIFFHDIPRTSINFDTWDVAPFKLRSEKAKPQFKDQDLNTLWEWSHGKTCRDLKVHPQALSRITKKFVKEVLERDNHSSLKQAIEDSVPSEKVMSV